MKGEERGIIRRITIELEYPGGESYTRIIEGEEAKCLALIAFTAEALRDHVGDIKHKDQAIGIFRDGFEAKDRGKPAMLILHKNDTYAMECDRESHRPGELR